ncbi:MAG: tRNA (cytidine(34)-2'-O)-methyltransferase [Candidatus Obscuribacterales bacterium]|nr:tRNA (cytidine(34)-2'-O)-methyltransferase [Steroidobacteraceae bacterium]
MFHVVLYQPEIPPNTGNAIRLCANTASQLHLIRPLGFELDEKRVRRAGLDYHEMAAVHEWDSLDECLTSIDATRWFAISTRGAMRHDQPLYTSGDVFIFGPETRGLPQELIEACPPENRLRLPMAPGNRSLNLSNAVAVVVFEAWRQLGFAGGA